jgi:peroxiredoxin
LSWQRPNGPAWRQVARGRIARARLAGRTPLSLRRPWLIALALGGTGLLAQAEPGYGLIGQTAPDFALHAAAGSNVRLSEHRGDVVVLSFWSSRCTPCRTQLTALSRSVATYRSAGLTVYGIGVDDDAALSLEYARSVRVDFQLLLDPSKGVARSYQVDNLPFTVLIDRGGNVRYALRDYSAASNGLYLQQLRALLNE